MQTNIVEITIHDKKQGIALTTRVAQIGEHKFRVIENEVLYDNLYFGTEFQTRLNEDGTHEIVRILKESAFVTRRFFLTSQFNEAEYRILGDEIIKHGGFWQVDFGAIATINLPKSCELDIDEIFRTFDFKPSEIID